jgi:LmbE family N-acetylglucosaminyl deacetylase
MRAGELLAAAHSFPILSLQDRLWEGGLVVLAPHPDDESLACGGIIARACEDGRATRIVIVSDGTGSHPNSRTHPRQKLRTLREAEALEAARELGLDARNITFLGLPDRLVPSEGPRAEQAVAKIVNCLEDVGAKALFVSWRHDAHADHQACYRLARAAQRAFPGVRLYEYTVWGAALPPMAIVEEPTNGFRIDTAALRAKKLRAIAAHRSQTTDLIKDDPQGFRLSAADLARFDLPYEFFFESNP